MAKTRPGVRFQREGYALLGFVAGLASCSPATSHSGNAGGTAGAGGSTNLPSGTSGAGQGQQTDAGQASGSGGSGGDPGQGPSGPLPALNKVDLVFMIDNSISMSDKQGLLGRSVSELVGQLVQPPCIDSAGRRQAPPGPHEECPAGQRQLFEPVTDINVAVISSSLGDIGANGACPDGGPRNDQGHLIASLPRGQGHGENASGVLEFRAGDDASAFTTELGALLEAVGQSGCGWEMSLESWYRFLVDPKPYQALTHTSCTPGGTDTDCVAPTTDDAGQPLVDQTLLDQRAAFLRPDSLLSIVMLTDENDCSLAPGPQNWVVVDNRAPRPMFRGSSACDANPNDACCYSCALNPPSGCTADPVCAGDVDAGTGPARLTPNEDGFNLRCFDQKRRFGMDFLYPTTRYVNALQQPALCLSAPDLAAGGCPEALVQNPLFESGRKPSSVFLAGIIGVPWELISATTSADGQALPDNALRFLGPSELDAAHWSQILGEPHASPPVSPSNPFMIESTHSRSDIPVGNPINGREYTTDPRGAPDDLEYACIFPMPALVDCSTVDPLQGTCDCFEGEFDRPLCEQNPGQSPAGTTQYWAKAYPGARELDVLHGLGQSGSVTSICARNVSNPEQPDFGYRPAMSSILERLQSRLRPTSP